jgi:membrane protease YdiL (CAAX protease family)
MSETRRIGPLVVGLYLIWLGATYLLEGREQLLQRPDPAKRAIYTVAANIVVGTLLAGWVVRWLIVRGKITLGQAGFRSLGRTLVAIVVATTVGFGIFVLQGPRSLEPLVVANVFAQVLPTTIAEIMVCWAVVGASTEGLVRRRGGLLAAITGALVASVLFGVYHFGNSAPFNQVAVVLFLTLISIQTDLVYFLGRDIYAAAIVHNYLGMTGIINSAPLEVFRQPIYPLYALAALAVLALIAIHIALVRAGGGVRDGRGA